VGANTKPGLNMRKGFVFEGDYKPIDFAMIDFITSLVPP
jgi:hypothetical protein